MMAWPFVTKNPEATTRSPLKPTASRSVRLSKRAVSLSVGTTSFGHEDASESGAGGCDQQQQQPHSVPKKKNSSNRNNNKNDSCSVPPRAAITFLSLDPRPNDSYGLANVKEMIRTMNQHDRSYFQKFKFGTQVVFDTIALDVATYYDVTQTVFAAFPDLRFRVGSLVEVQPGTIVATVWVDGRHTGVDYTTPQYPNPIPATDVHVKLGPETWIIVFDGMKIAKYQISSTSPYNNSSNNQQINNNKNKYAGGPNGLYQILERKLEKQERRSLHASMSSFAY